MTLQDFPLKYEKTPQESIFSRAKYRTRMSTKSFNNAINYVLDNVRRKR